MNDLDALLALLDRFGITGHTTYGPTDDYWLAAPGHRAVVLRAGYDPKVDGYSFFTQFVFSAEGTFERITIAE